MLVLGRKKNESIVIPELGITIHVVNVDRGNVRIGIDAPKSIQVYRREVYERIEQGNTQGGEK